jgi:hypothetical protein
MAANRESGHTTPQSNWRSPLRDFVARQFFEHRVALVPGADFGYAARQLG